MTNINYQFLLSIAIILLGYLLKKGRLVREEDSDALSRIIFNVTLPALITVTFSTITIDISLILLTVISITYGFFMTFVGWLVFRKEGIATRGMYSMLLLGFNLGLFAYPLVEAVWGQEGIKYFGMFDVGNSFLIFGLAYLVGSHYSGKQAIELKHSAAKLLKSVPLITYMVSFVLAVFSLNLPPQIIDVAKILAKANMPLSLLLLGICLSFSFKANYAKGILKVLALRYLVGLMIGLLFFYFAPFGAMFKYTLLIGFILPIGLAAIPYSIEFNYDASFVGTITNMTNIISFALIWLIVLFAASPF